MGYFSRLAAQLSVRPVKDRELYEPTKAEQLDIRLTDLETKLVWLEKIRPHDPLDPKFDYYFYEDYIVSDLDIPELEPEEDAIRFPYTVEGLNRAIAIVREKLNALCEESVNGARFMFSVYLTGTTPDGQCALANVFDPEPYGIHFAA